jgi:hypothetical protein
MKILANQERWHEEILKNDLQPTEKIIKLFPFNKWGIFMRRTRLTSLLMIVSFSLFGLLLGSDLFAKEKQKKYISREDLLVAHVKNSLFQAEKNGAALNAAVLHLEGSSSPKVGSFLNYLCTLPETSYLEIGSWKGATCIPALYKNEAAVTCAIAVDRWTDLAVVKTEFLHNIETFIPRAHLRLIDADCFQINKSEVFHQPVTVFFYDGLHSKEDQEMAFTYFDEIFDDLFIAVVNHWNAPNVELGTREAFQKLEYQIVFEKKLMPNSNRDNPFCLNDLYIALIKKKPCGCY